VIVPGSFLATSAMPMTNVLVAGLILFAAHFVSTVSGFGSNILGLPLLAMVVGLQPGKQSLIVLGSLLYLYLTVRWWKRVDVRQMLFITLIAGIGLPVGMALFQHLPERGSILLLSLFVIAVGARGLFRLAPNYQAPRWLATILLFLGGVVHGAFTIGGPLLAVYARRALPHKSAFRSTLAVMWLALAIGLMAGWTAGGTWDAATLRVTLVGLPFLVAGLIVGEYLHHRVNEDMFRSTVNATLIAVGAILLLTHIN
jgi:uncharacterized protein